MNITLVYIDLAVVLCSLVFCMFLMVVYFSHRNMNNIDNKIYKYLLIFNFLNNAVHALFIYSFLLDFYSNHYEIFIILDKLRLSFMLTYYYLLLSYIVIVCFGVESKIYSFIIKNKILYFFVIPFSIGLFEFLLPMDIVIKSNAFYNVGLGDTCWFIIAFSYIFICVTSIFINRKRVERKKIVPFYILIFLSIFCMFFPLIGSVIQLTATLVSYLMYHTIENPDLKLITELELARDQAEKSNNAKSDFLSSMSHELRTPLNAIVGCTDLIMSTDNVNDIHEDCKDIINASNNLIELVDGILDFNKIENNSLELIEKDYNPLDLFNNLIKLYNSKIGDKNITIESMISDKLPNTLYGDSDKIKTIINNLLSNALKYTNEGLIQLSVTCFNVKDRCNLTIAVSDSGMGISEEDSEHIFEKFYRSIDNKNSDIEGTGLGLAITKSLVDILNGKIVVNSEVNQGTTFIVSISQLIKETNDKDDIL